MFVEICLIGLNFQSEGLYFLFLTFLLLFLIVSFVPLMQLKFSLQIASVFLHLLFFSSVIKVLLLFLLVHQIISLFFQVINEEKLKVVLIFSISFCFQMFLRLNSFFNLFNQIMIISLSYFSQINYCYCFAILSVPRGDFIQLSVCLFDSE